MTCVIIQIYQKKDLFFFFCLFVLAFLHHRIFDCLFNKQHVLTLGHRVLDDVLPRVAYPEGHKSLAVKARVVTASCVEEEGSVRQSSTGNPIIALVLPSTNPEVFLDVLGKVPSVGLLLLYQNGLADVLQVVAVPLLVNASIRILHLMHMLLYIHHLAKSVITRHLGFLLKGVLGLEG